MYDNKQVEFGPVARKKVIEGVDIIANAVKSTLGPKGRNVLIDLKFGSPRVTKDGVSVAQEINLEDRFQNMGVQLIKEVAAKTGNEVGDGTTTSTVIAQSIINQSQNIRENVNPILVKKGIDKALAYVLNEIEKRSIVCDTVEQLIQVATISCNGDSELGKIVGEALFKIKGNGVVSVDVGNTIETTSESTEGLRVDKGWSSPVFVNSEKMIAEYKDAVVILCNEKLNDLQPLAPIMESVLRAGRPMVFICNDYNPMVLGALIANRVKNNLPIVAIKTPGGLPTRMKETLEDIASIVGGTVIDSATGYPLASYNETMIGIAPSIKVTKDDTLIIANSKEFERTAKRIEYIKDQLEVETNDYEKKFLSTRLAKLTGGAAIIRVGGYTETEINEKKDRVDDAVASTRAALLGGILPGGGSTLAKVANFDKSVIKTDHKDEEVGVEILRKALESPFRQLMKNAGLDEEAQLSKLLDHVDTTVGMNLVTEEFVDMIEAGIIDPTLVTTTALKEAASVASTMITTDTVIAHTPKQEKDDQ